MTGPSSRLFLSMIVHTTGSHARSGSLAGKNVGFLDFEDYAHVAAIAHEGTIDTLWRPDVPRHIVSPDAAPLHTLDPILLMTALARSVPDIGVAPTVSTSFNSPFTIARHIATLDHISNGRAGVNLVASWDPRVAQNFGQEEVGSHDDRYRKAEEFVETFIELSDSWKLRSSGEGTLTYDPELVHSIDHVGEFFSVKGPLNVPQTHQGRPLISVAGGSEQTRRLAARFADVLYTSLVDKSAAQDFTRDIRQRARAHGRPEGCVKIMPGLIPVIGSTEKESLEKLDFLTTRAGRPTDPLEIVGRLLEIDPADLHPDRQLTEEQMVLPPTWVRPQGFFHSITDVARRGQLTVRELARHFQLGGGHHVLVGTPDVVAGTMLDWWRDGASDGFTIMSQVLPDDARLFVDEIVPILRKEGGFPSHYTGDTLTERFEIPPRAA